ncbi:MAG: glycosyltransferase family 39 protein, partial [Candidatus Omnitrophota bacterium]
MINIMKRPILPVIIFLALSWYLFFFRLDAMGLTDPDETFYAQTAKEMLSKNEWLVPHIFGKPQFEKPVFFYWLVEISFKAFGVNETAARLPSAVFGMIGIAATYFLGSLLFNKRTGLLGAIMLATSVEYIILSRACVTDMTLFSLMLLGALFFFYGHLKDRLYAYLLSAAFFALAVLTKGPIAVMLPGLALILYFVFTRDWKSFTKIPFLRMTAVFIAVAAPWYLAMYKVHGNVFIDAFFGFQNIIRFTQSEHKIGSQVWYNIPILLGGFFPWSVFLPFGLWSAIKKVTSGQS